jgi:hypothetical protein
MLRLAVLLLVAGAAVADERTDVLDWVAPLATALSEGDAAAFLGAIDKNMPKYGDLEANVTGLLNAADVTCSVEFIASEGDTATLDWYMQIKSKEQAGVAEERRGRVTVRLGKKKVLDISPVSFFAFRPGAVR